MGSVYPEMVERVGFRWPAAVRRWREGRRSLRATNGFTLDPRFSGGGYFGGPSGIACPSCSLPLLNLVTITQQRALRLCGWREKTLQVVFCWRCGAGQAPFWYRHTSNSLHLLQHGNGAIVEDFPYTGYPEQVPVIEFGLTALPPQLASLQQGLANEVDWPHDLVRFLETPRHQFLGAPFLHDEREHTCLSCGKRMKLVLTIENDIGEGYIQTDNSDVMLVVKACTDCSILVVEQQCE